MGASGDSTALKIAVTGMAVRLPGAVTPAQYWRNLYDRVESIRRFSEEELLAAGLAADDVRAPNFVPARGALDRIGDFDAAFFGMSPRDAAATDPQQRLLLECCWEALEDAGATPTRTSALTGTFVGVARTGYGWRVKRAQDVGEPLSNLVVAIGTDEDYAATRIAYKLNLRGPALSIQTACSTGLVAVATACQSLLAGGCNMALAGASSVRPDQTFGYRYYEGGIMSPDGHCRAFDDDARGSVGASGVAVVVLKRLEDALRDGDPIRAVIIGFAVNNDGADKVGFTAPGIAGQAEVIRRAHLMARIPVDTIRYVEAHGTGTPVGDPVEIAALTQAFRQATSKVGFCRIGSVKTNIGHTDAASGVAGLIKTVLALQHRQIPASLHFRTPNHRIAFSETPFVVNTDLCDWPDAGTARAGVSSFGIGGTNAHVVLEEAAPLPARAPSNRSHLFVFSARTESAVRAFARSIGEHARAHPDDDAGDVAATLQEGRDAFAWRCAVVARSLAELPERLARPMRIECADRTRGRDVAFLFPGQGEQRLGMARELYDGIPAFRKPFDRCLDYLSAAHGLTLRPLLFGSDEGPAGEAALRRTDVAQPAIFAVEYALAQTLIACGCRPAAMLGHSIGELTCAALAGVFELHDALDLIVRRGALMNSMAPGAMLAAGAPWSRVQSLVEEHGLELAAINAPERIVVAGPLERIAALEEALRAVGIPPQRLATSHAFHSSMMAPAADEFARAVAARRRRAPAVPYISNLTGGWIGAREVADPDYWRRHIREAVRFSDGLGTLLANPDLLLIEVGPGRALSTLAKMHPSLVGMQPALTGSVAADQRSPLAALLNAVGGLWIAGMQIDWRPLRAEASIRKVSLPTYPFERQPYWVEAPRARSAPAAVATREVGGESPRGGPPDILGELKVFLSRATGVPPGQIDADADFDRAGADSLALIQFVQAIRDRFRIDIAYRRLLDGLPTPAHVAAYIAAHIEQGRAAEASRPSAPAPLQRAGSVGQASISGPLAAVAAGHPSRDYPFFSSVVDLRRFGYVEEEYVLEGTACRYKKPTGAGGVAIVDAGSAYRTRVVVRRPIDLRQFNGTVLAEWNNVTAGWDLEIDWFQTWEHLMRAGYVWAGVSAQRVGVEALKLWNPKRYGALDVTGQGTVDGDALSFDIFAQACQAIRTPGAGPLGALMVEHVIATGHSQSANKLAAFVNAGRPMAGVVDAAILHGGGGRVQDHLDIPVFKLLAETDLLEGEAAARQPDTDRFRSWEVAGSSHLDLRFVEASGTLAQRDGIPRSPASAPADGRRSATEGNRSSHRTWYSRVPFHFVMHAAIDHLVAWVRDAVPPPIAPPLETLEEGSSIDVARDRFGNALGGIRLAEHAVPLGVNKGKNSSTGRSRFNGFHEPFDAATLAALYPSWAQYVADVRRVTEENVKAGYILDADACATIAAAEQWASCHR